jgi:hypothetical protein
MMPYIFLTNKFVLIPNLTYDDMLAFYRGKNRKMQNYGRRRKTTGKKKIKKET